MFSVLTWPHPFTHSLNYTSTHGWGSLHRFQIFKQNWNISISSSAIEFWLILGAPWEVGVGGWRWGGERVPPCMCTHTHMHVWHHTEFPGTPPMATAICMKLSSLPCMHVHMCGGHPQPPSTPIHPAPYPQSCREPKTPKFNKSWTNRDN